MRNEFVTYMQILRQGKGVLGKLARVHQCLEKKNETTFLTWKKVITNQKRVLDFATRRYSTTYTKSPADLKSAALPRCFEAG